MASTFKLKFLTESGEAAYITIPYAKKSLTDADIKAAMLKIITTGAVVTDGGALKTSDGASRIDTDGEEIALS